jgi:hypothetical protein
MPYIENEKRGKWNSLIAEAKKLIADIPEEKREGELNYFISRLLKEIYAKNPSYAEYNKAIGLLECIKQEFYRMQVAPYEDKKKKEHGPV